MKNKALFKAIVLSIQKHPEEWEYQDDSKFCISHIKSELIIWIANGFFFYKIYKPEKISFSFWQKIEFHFSFKKWCKIVKFNEETEEIERANKLYNNLKNKLSK